MMHQLRFEAHMFSRLADTQAAADEKEGTLKSIAIRPLLLEEADAHLMLLLPDGRGAPMSVFIRGADPQQLSDSALLRARLGSPHSPAKAAGLTVPGGTAMHEYSPSNTSGSSSGSSSVTSNSGAGGLTRRLPPTTTSGSIGFSAASSAPAGAGPRGAARTGGVPKGRAVTESLNLSLDSVRTVLQCVLAVTRELQILHAAGLVHKGEDRCTRELL